MRNIYNFDRPHALFYILKGKKLIPTDDVMECFDHWRGRKHHINIAKLPGDIIVSTVFLGFNRQFGLEDPPILFETTITGLEHNEKYKEYYSTYEQAEAGHQKAIEYVFKVR